MRYFILQKDNTIQELRNTDSSIPINYYYYFCQQCTTIDGSNSLILIIFVHVLPTATFSLVITLNNDFN